MIDERLKQIADHYGLDEQLNMLQEECAELIQAVNKYKRTRTTAIVEEMADVYIMLYQITYLLNKEVASVNNEERMQGELTADEKRLIGVAVEYLLGAELLEENGWSENDIKVLQSLCERYYVEDSEEEE